jgi:hypothetical protein
MLLCPQEPATAPPPIADQDADEPAISAADRDDIALTALIVIWAVRTGRALRDVPAEQWSSEELIAFWADDQLPDELAGPSRPLVSGR